MSAADDSESYRRGGARPEVWEPVDPDIPALRSSAREVVGRPAARRDGDVALDVELPRPATLRELDRSDEIVALGVPKKASKRRALRECRFDHLVAIRWLDRFGCMTTEQLHRAVLPGLSLRSMQALVREMHGAGLVESRRTQLAIRDDRGRGGSTPRMWSLTTAGFRLGQKSPGFHRPVKGRTRRRSETEKSMRLHHDLHVIGWWLAFCALVGDVVDIRDVFTPRYEEGRLRPPRVSEARGRGSRPIELRDIQLGDGLTFASVPDEPFKHALQPDLTIHARIHGWLVGRQEDLQVDLLIEVDRTKRGAYNRKKLASYDAFLTGCRRSAAALRATAPRQQPATTTTASGIINRQQQPTRGGATSSVHGGATASGDTHLLAPYALGPATPSLWSVRV